MHVVSPFNHRGCSVCGCLDPGLCCKVSYCSFHFTVWGWRREAIKQRFELRFPSLTWSPVDSTTVTHMLNTVDFCVFILECQFHNPTGKERKHSVLQMLALSSSEDDVSLFLWISALLNLAWNAGRFPLKLQHLEARRSCIYLRVLLIHINGKCLNHALKVSYTIFLWLNYDTQHSHLPNHCYSQIIPSAHWQIVILHWAVQRKPHALKPYIPTKWYFSYSELVEWVSSAKQAVLLRNMHDLRAKMKGIPDTFLWVRNK